MAHNRKVVFVDIDGVLNGHGHDPKPYAVFDDDAMRRLKVLLERSQAHIVLSTSWRKHLSYLNHVFANYGLLGKMSPSSGPERAIASEMRTPCFADPRRRDLEILRWLQLNRATLGVESWVVLDDMDVLAFPDTRDQLLGHVVQTNPTTGLTDADVEAAVAILGTPSELGQSCPKVTVSATVSPASGRLRSALQPMDGNLLQSMGAVLQALRQEPVLKCKDGHGMAQKQIPCTGFCCEDCGIDLVEGSWTSQCESCGGIYLCADCAAPVSKTTSS